MDKDGVAQKGIGEKFVHFYDKYHYKLLAIPLLVVIISFAVLGINYATTGSPIKKDVSLSGGVTLTITKQTNVTAAELQGFLESRVDYDTNVRVLSQSGNEIGLIVDAGVSDQQKIKTLLSIVEEKTGKLDANDYSAQVIGTALGQSFFTEALFAIAFAFLLMGAAVLIYFRNLVPSMFVILCGFNDLLCTVGALVLLDFRFSTASIAALLMVVGYSIDTDILLTTRVLKGKEGTVFSRTVGAMKTGVTMSLTAFAAVFAGYLFSQSQTIKEIMLVISIAMIFDILHTWITNAAILRWYLERKKHGQA